MSTLPRTKHSQSHKELGITYLPPTAPLAQTLAIPPRTLLEQSPFSVDIGDLSDSS